MSRLKSVASYAVIAASVVTAYFPNAASAQDDQYAVCIQGCFQTWGAGSANPNNLRFGQCASICEQRYIGGDGNNPPQLPRPPSGLPIVIWP